MVGLAYDFTELFLQNPNMDLPSTDIIIPVWNQPFETRACLVSILNSCGSARTIIINNSCNRDTELMLEEFCDSRGEKALYMCMERNIGFIPALNHGLAHSNADWAMIARSNSIFRPGWHDALISATSVKMAGIISPLRINETDCPKQVRKNRCDHIETTGISFAGMLVSRKLRQEIGLFDEEMDGGSWCLRDFQNRAAASGYLTLLAPDAVIESSPPTIFGSDERRKARESHSESLCHSRWGIPGTYAVYISGESTEEQLEHAFKTMLAAARRGHRFNVLLHRKQFRRAEESGFSCIHTSISMTRLNPVTPMLSLKKHISSIIAENPSVMVVKLLDSKPVPGYDMAMPFAAIEKLTNSAKDEGNLL